MLGDSNRWWGWQCRWYDLKPGDQLGGTRRKAIEDAIRKTEEYVSGVTDWVLWTRRPLTPADQDWFSSIDSAMRLYLWTEEDLNAHLVGDAEVLRRSYFGDLILTADELSQMREVSLASVRKRWMPEVHVKSEAETNVRSLLGEATVSTKFSEQLNVLNRAIQDIDNTGTNLPAILDDDVTSLISELSALRETFADIVLAFGSRDWSRVADIASSCRQPRLTHADARRVGRTLSKIRHPACIPVQAGFAWQFESKKLLDDLHQAVETRVIAVTGLAGFGKTHLAAELTAATPGRTSGIYLEAWGVTSRGSLEETLPTEFRQVFKSFGDLLEAADAAGARAGTRIPIVIDGLNESEDPLIWLPLLKRLQVALERYRHVLVIVTARSLLADKVIPEGCRRLELQGFSTLTREAIQKYFAHYKIRPGSVRLPLSDLANPLFLRIFCEATNPDREIEVSAEMIPASLATVFMRYRDTIVDRIAAQPGGPRWTREELIYSLDQLTLALWTSKERAIGFQALRELIGDLDREWTHSLARIFRDEGLLGVADTTDGDPRTIILFDAFAGFLIADALSRRVKAPKFPHWVSEQFADGPLAYGSRDAHPLADDIRKALVALAPRVFHTNIWEHTEAQAREEALIEGANLERQYLDSHTVEAIAQIATNVQGGVRSSPVYRLYDRLREIRDIPNHPLNATFLDSILVRLPVAGRDLTWTEWVRRRETTIFSDLDGVEKYWRERTQRTPRDRLDAVWIKWLLTSTLRELRDLATRALYWYGRGDPNALFELVRSSVYVNDPYIIERLLAATYGVLMAAPGERRDFGDELRAFLDVLWDAYCSDAPECPTEHWLVREYLDGIVRVVTRYYPSALGKWRDGGRYATPSRPTPIGRDDSRQASESLVHGLDFENYTVGRLVPGRRNYDYGHPRFEEVLSWIRARVWQLGWRHDQFRALENEMSGFRASCERDSGRLESYRKKYGWIGFYEAAGRLVAEGRPPFTDGQNRLSDLDIDPSFPVMPPHADFSLPNWLGESSADLRTWVTKGTVEIPDSLLRAQVLAQYRGPWLATSGYLEQQDENAKRAVLAIARAFLVPRDDLPLLRQSLEESPDPAWFCPMTPESAGVFVGETPWWARARTKASSDVLKDLYSRSLRTTDGREIRLELIDHHYSWVGNPLSTTEASEHLMPAVTLAETFDLRWVPNSLDWCDGNGERASVVLSAPAECRDGHLVYVREDLIRQYCDERNYSLVWIVYGERITWSTGASGEGFEWLVQAHEDNEHMWSCVKSLEELTDP